MKKIYRKLSYHIITKLNSKAVTMTFSDGGMDIDVDKLNVFGIWALRLIIKSI